MNQNQAIGFAEKANPEKDTPIAEAARRLMRAIGEQEKVIEQLRDVLRPAIRPMEIAEDTKAAGRPPAPIRSPMADGIHERAAQIEGNTDALRDIIVRVEL